MSESDSSTARHRPAARKNRPRAGSIKEALENIEHDPNHHIAGAMADSANSTPSSSPNINSLSNTKLRYANEKRRGLDLPGVGADRTQPSGLWHDVKTMRWMREPASSFKLLMIPIVLYANFELVIRYVLERPYKNPFAPLLFISYYLPDSDPSDPRFDKGWLDLVFLAYYVIFFSFLRQSITIHVLIPLAKVLGIKKESKFDRFAEQGYAVLYFGFFGSLGLYVMSGMPTWWFRTEHFWLEYPHWRMTGIMKTYYLLQAAYWIQQLLVMVLGLEKPRKDFVELVIHHLVTIFLVSSSYIVNLTWIGNAVFITMDVSDVFLALSKIFNYLKMNKSKFVAFAWSTVVWTYCRHYLNLKFLYSVWFEFDLIPEQYMKLDFADHAYMPWWGRPVVFFPIFLLQLVNLFWYFLIWRILIRALFAPDLDKVDDDRSDDECDGDDEGDDDDEKSD
ncbi:TLC domain protein [Ceratobasidium sp. AG-Ba]|nr:TLC domain protein [Ceratobasidium sp. AG-Ba]QRW02222.1 TLC domain protein [Ceratobasidium sp. AG-Ba]